MPDHEGRTPASTEITPMITFLKRLRCWAMGHNLIGLDLPPGWSVRPCLDCGRDINAFRRPNPITLELAVETLRAKGTIHADLLADEIERGARRQPPPNQRGGES